jgi:hypothetical protein
MRGASFEARAWALGLAASVAFGCGSRSRLWFGNTVDGGTDVSSGASGGGPAFDAGATTGGGSSAGTSSAGTSSAGSGGLPCVPAREVCNGLDDDCDGEVDEDLPLELSGDGDPVVVRSTEGRTFDCTTCAWAWYPKLVEAGADLGVIWYLGIYGGNEHPSGFRRRLDAFGAPLGEVESLGDPVWLKYLARGAQHQRGTLVTFFERQGNFDLQGYAFVGADLELSQTTLLEECDWHLGLPAAPFPNVVLCMSYPALHVYGLDAVNGAIGPHSEQSIQPTSNSTLMPYTPPVGAEREGHRLVLVTPSDRTPEGDEQQFYWALELATDGTPLSPPKVTPVGVGHEFYVVGLFPNPVREGFVAFGLEQGFSPAPGLAVLEFDYDGTPLGEIEYRDTDVGLVALDVIPHGDGFLLAARAYSPSDGSQFVVVERLDAAGFVLERWQGPEGLYGTPSILTRDGRVFVVFVDDPVTDEANAVRLFRFGCVE